MTMAQDEVVNGLLAELRNLHGLVATITHNEWAAPTRCEGWTVFDIAAHVTGVMADITAGRLEGIDTQPWYDRQVDERRGRPPQALIEELDHVTLATEELMTSFDEAAWNGPAAPGIVGTLGAAILSLWCGIYIHCEDILAALGRPAQKGPGLRAAIATIADVLTDRGWGPATLALALDGVGDVAIRGGGRRIEADPLTFTLVASGRADPAILGVDTGVNIYG
jgi:uncharacterized protein (TIGR03083 family)